MQESVFNRLQPDWAIPQRRSPCHAGPFIKLGPLRNVGQGVAERAGCLSGAGLVVILTVCLTIYGAAAFQVDQVPMGVKTLSGRELQKDSLQVRPWSSQQLYVPSTLQRQCL